MEAHPDTADLLVALSEGQREALDALVHHLYEQLRQLAQHHLRHERAGHPLCTTALVHEAYLKLVEIRRMRWHDQAHFLAMASRVMRRILIDYIHRRQAEKRGGGWHRAAWAEALAVPDAYAGAVLEVRDACRRLAASNPRQGQILEYYVLAGLTLGEIAEALDVSRSTVKREMRLARARLARWLAPAVGTPSALAIAAGS